MASLADLHGALAGRLATIDGLRVAPYPPGEERVPPRAHIQLDTWVPSAMARRGLKTYTFRVLVFTAATVRPQDGYAALMDYADPASANSIELAVWDGNDTTAGTFTGRYSGTTYVCATTVVRIVDFAVLGAEDVDLYQMYGGLFAVEARTQDN